MKKTKLFNSIAVALGVSIGTTSAMAAELEEIVVTATKRSASTQDVAVAVTAISGDSLDELNVDNFTDYLLQLPNVSASSTGPGQGTVFIRGVASSPVFLTISGSAGLAPNVAMYLDEQPTTQVGRNLDVYAADLSRIEVLPGPQGTLFGASSQAGTVRLITNKPDFDSTYGKVSAGFSSTKGGDNSTKVEAMLNVPINDKFAVRGVIYNDQQGGYIDNVPGTISARDGARFRPAGPRSNGTPFAGGFQAGADLSAVNFIDFKNTQHVQDNINDAVYSGIRLGATYLFNDEWSLNATYMNQKLDTEGVFFGDPELGSDLTKIQRYAAEDSQDTFDNLAWTLEGNAAGLEMVYTGSFLDRETEYSADYTDYLFVGQYFGFYICDSSVTYPGAAAPAGNCYAPTFGLKGGTYVESTTHELRFSTPEDNTLKATFGIFYSDGELNEQTNHPVPSAALIDNGAGFPSNIPYPGSTVGNPNPRDPSVVFFNDYIRTEEQFGLFAEGTWDINEKLALTLGVRSYDVETDLTGSTNLAFANLGADVDQIRGANLDFIFDGNNVDERDPTGGTLYPQIVPDKAVNKGENYKASLAYKPTENQLWYITYSEGFRPGMLNRPAFSSGVVPPVVRTDELTNFELGWKLDLLNGSLRLNGNIFKMEIDDLQVTVLDNTIANIFFSDNAADAEVTGVEADITWAATDNLLVSSAFSILDTEIVGLAGVESVAIAPVGSELAYAPGFQGNIRARYTWESSNNSTSHVQAQANYSASSFSDIVSINRVEQDSYTLVNAAYGITNDVWGVELFVENLTNEAAQLNKNFNYDAERIAIVRPRTIGLRVSFGF